MDRRATFTVLALGSLISTNALAQQAPAGGPPGPETVQNMLAAQIRTQGFPCDKPLGATRDAKRSKPDRDVWVLTCSNAKYRVSRAPDMSATVEALK